MKNNHSPTKSIKTPILDGYEFLGVSKMAKLIAKFDWSVTSLGPITTWPNHLRSVLSIILQSPVPMAIFWGDEGSLLYNDSYAVIAGSRHPKILGIKVVEAWPEVADFDQTILQTCLNGSSLSFTDQKLSLFRHEQLEEIWFDLNYSPIMDEQGQAAGVLAVVTDTTRHVHAKRRTEEQNQVLEMITSDVSLAEALEFLIITIEKQSPDNMKGSILLLSEDKKHLVHGAAPSLPKEYNEAINGLTIGPNAGSCGTAAYTKKPIIVTDTQTDPLWKDYKDLAKRHNLRSCWSIPILSAQEDLLGTFALYYPESRSPSAQDRLIIDFVLRTAALTIERKQAVEALKDSEERFRTLADNVQNLVWIADPEGKILWYNQRWYDYTGTPAEEALGWGWKKGHHPDHLDRVNKFVTQARAKGEPWELTYPLRFMDGQYGWFLTRAAPIKTTSGRVERWIGTNTDIEDLRRRHEIEQRMELLTEQRNALLKINKAKDEFIGMASHQLRTPATAVKQYVGLLMDLFGGPLTPEQTHYLQIAYDSNERQLTVINDLLKTAQLDSTKYRLNKQHADVSAIIQEAIADLGSTFEMRKQSVGFKAPAKPIKVLVDATEIKLVFLNLLENASKYSYPETEIKVSVEQDETHIAISFSDKGVGISKDNQQRVFDKFTRVDNELSDTVTGTGLGLYWVKQIVELHKGSIKLTSALGKGSTFTIRLPL